MAACQKVPRSIRRAQSSANSLLKNGDWLRADRFLPGENAQGEVPVPVFQQTANPAILAAKAPAGQARRGPKPRNNVASGAKLSPLSSSLFAPNPPTISFGAALNFAGAAIVAAPRSGGYLIRRMLRCG